jgi:hypothetical protein
VKRTCDGRDPNLLAEDCQTPCACGLTFDDVDRLVIYPHQPIGPKLTYDELMELYREMGDGR